MSDQTDSDQPDARAVALAAVLTVTTVGVRRSSLPVFNLLRGIRAGRQAALGDVVGSPR